MLEDVFTPQQYKRMLDLISKVRWIECPSYLQKCWRMFSHHNNIKGCWILYPRSDGSSVHHISRNIGGCFHTTTILKDVGSYIQGPMDRVSIISLEMLEEVFTPQQYKRMLDLISKVRWIECPSYL